MEELFKLLDSLKDSTGDFACSGSLPKLGLPGLVVKNIGQIPLPVQQEQAKKIIEVAKKAPFGLGVQTVVDESVRKTWQLDPNQITIENQHFLAGVHEVVSAVKKQLGCNKKAVKAKLYKVLLYEEGGHFKAHRDTEKERGMFATLVIQLPSQFKGGKVTIRHAGKEKIVEMDGDGSAYCCKYAAHYSDCEHEVSKVTSGYRLALVYSLCWTAHGDPPSADAVTAVARNVAKILPVICTGDRHLFCWFLSHKYSKSGLSGSGVGALKGGDAAVAQALQQANGLLQQDQQFDFYFAEVNRELQQFGDFWDEDSWEGGFQPNGDEEEEVNIEDWLQFDGTPANLKMAQDISLDIEHNVVNFQRPRGNMSIKQAIQHFWGEADDEENSGPTGNEGATQTYWYKSYAIFAWQKDNEVNLRCKLNGYYEAVKWVSEKFKEVEKDDPSSSKYQDAMSSLKMLIDYAVSNSESLSTSAISIMLNIIAKLRTEAVELANRFIAEALGKSVIPETYYRDDGGKGKPLVDLIELLGWPSLSQSVVKLFNLSPVSEHGNLAKFLKSLSEKNIVSKEDESFKSMVKFLVEKVEADVQNNQLESPYITGRVIALAVLLFEINDVNLLTKFTNAIQVHCQQSPTSPLPQSLARYLELAKGKINHNQFWNQLLKLRIAQLEGVEKAGVPPFTWNQVDAVLANYPQVEEFLRGPNQSMSQYGFTNICQARKFAEMYFGRTPCWGYLSRNTPPRSYTATATAVGSGRNARVLIEKTREWYDKKYAPVLQKMEELKKLRGLLNPSASQPTPARSSETAEQLEPQAKRRATEAVFIG